MVYSRIWLLGELIADSIFEDRLNDDKKKFDKRSKLSINNKVNDIGKEIKLFRVDGVIPKEQFMPLVTSYFYWNYDLLCYFCKNLVK